MLACEQLASLLASCCKIILQLSRTSRHDPKMKIGSELTRGSAEKATRKKKQKGKKATVSKNNTPSVRIFHLVDLSSLHRASERASERAMKKEKVR